MVKDTSYLFITGPDVVKVIFVFEGMFCKVTAIFVQSFSGV